MESLNFENPTRRSPSSRSKRVSVAAGESVTIRREVGFDAAGRSARPQPKSNVLKSMRWRMEKRLFIVESEDIAEVYGGFNRAVVFIEGGGIGTLLSGVLRGFIQAAASAGGENFDSPNRSVGQNLKQEVNAALFVFSFREGGIVRFKFSQKSGCGYGSCFFRRSDGVFGGCFNFRRKSRSWFRRGKG